MGKPIDPSENLHLHDHGDMSPDECKELRNIAADMIRTGNQALEEIKTLSKSAHMSRDVDLLYAIKCATASKRFHRQGANL